MPRARRSRSWYDRVEERRIAPSDSGIGAFGALYHSAVATNGRDRIYVLSQEDAQLVVFADDGSPITRLGRRGQGPGEMEFADDVSVAPDGTVQVYDYNRSTFIRFAPDGAVAPTVRLPRDSAGTPDTPGRVVTSGLLYARDRYVGDSVTREMLLATARDTTVLAAHTVAVVREVAFTSCPVRLFRIPPYFSSELTIAATASEVAVQRGGDWRVEWYDGTALREVWTRRVPVQPSTLALLEQELEGGMRINFGSGTCTIPIEETARVRGMAPVLPALRRIAVAPDGTLWAERYTPRGGTPSVDVLTRQGELLGTIAGRGAPYGFLSGGRVVYAETDPETDVASLVILLRRRSRSDRCLRCASRARAPRWGE
jgi:hypothetical protein